MAILLVGESGLTLILKKFMTKNLLILFVKNPILGQAKTRLAASIGDTKALEIYKFLLAYTAKISQDIAADKQVCYAKHIEANDRFFKPSFFEAKVQAQGDLGDKMNQAFLDGFEQKYSKIVLIGSDCYELDSRIIEQAFEALDNNNFVLGPAKDGGYYLIGMRQRESAVFYNKKWSTKRVLLDTLIDLEVLGYRYQLLPTLNDIDYLEDLPKDLRLMFGLNSEE